MSFPAAVEQATHPPASSMMYHTDSPANNAAQIQLQRKLEQLRYAAWENDLTVIKDVLQSLEEDSSNDNDDGYDSDMLSDEHNPVSTSVAAPLTNAGFGALHYAASLGNLEMLQSILAANVVDIDELDKDGNTALVRATLYVDGTNSSGGKHATEVELQLMEALVDNGADVNKGNFEGETPLSAAVKLGCVEKVAYLLENGADPNAKDIDGATCLHYAASMGCGAIAALLLKNGAFLNCTDEWDECALHWAVREGGESAARIVKLLAQHGAVLDLCNEDGETPLDLAVETGDNLMVQTLLSLGAMASGFGSMAIADDCNTNFNVVGNASVAINPSAALEQQQKAAPGLLAWSAEANRVMRACELSLTHLAA